jgi:hypothetical protein
MNRAIEQEFFGVIWRIRLKSKSKTEVKRADVFVGARIGIDPVIETDRSDR